MSEKPSPSLEERIMQHPLFEAAYKKRQEKLVGAFLVEQAIQKMEAAGLPEEDAYAHLKTGRLPAPVSTPNQRRVTRRHVLAAGLGVLGLGIANRATAGADLPSSSPNASEQTEKRDQSTILDEFIKPFVEEAKRRRAERVREDPECYYRVDRELNEDRINILLFVSGAFLRWGHDRVINRANQIISYNTKTRTVDLISITGDVRGPRAEQYALKKGRPPKLEGINDSFDVGKNLGGSEAEALKLQRESFEEATGLSIDFQGVGTSGSVKDFIDQVFGGIDVNIPYDFQSYKVEIDKVEYPDYPFKKGPAKLDGVRVVQYIAADDYDREWTKGVKNKLHHNRKHIIFSALREAVKKSIENPIQKAIFGTKFGAFLRSQLESGRLKLDFEIGKMLNFGIFTDPSSLSKPLGFNEIKEGQSVVIVDPVYGGDGVKTVKADAEHNPKSRQDLTGGRYGPEIDFGYGRYNEYYWLQIPPNSNPDSKDLVRDYWGVAGGPRDIIKRKLLSG